MVSNWFIFLKLHSGQKVLNIILALRAIRKFGNKNFYVVTVPGNDTTILSYLKPYHIKTINLSGITEHLNDSTYCTLIDRHPSAKANKLVAEEIIKAIGDF